MYVISIEFNVYVVVFTFRLRMILWVERIEVLCERNVKIDPITNDSRGGGKQLQYAEYYMYLLVKKISISTLAFTKILFHTKRTDHTMYVMNV